MTEQQLTPEQLEDVEAHGLREIAVGIAAAGVMGSGGAALAAASGPSIPPVPIVEQARDDAMAAAEHATGAVSQLGRDAGTLAEHATANAHGIVDPVVLAAQNTAADTVRFAEDTVSRTRTAVDRTADAAISNVDRTIDSTARYATSTASSTVATVTSTVTATKDTVNRTVAPIQRTVESTAQSAIASALTVVRTVEDLADRWTVEVGVLGAEVSARGSLTNPSGTVSVSDGMGRVLATADIRDGHATLSFDTPAASGSLTIHYPGDGTWGPSTQVLHLPPSAL